MTLILNKYFSLKLQFNVYNYILFNRFLIIMPPKKRFHLNGWYHYTYISILVISIYDYIHSHLVQDIVLFNFTLVIRMFIFMAYGI